MAGKEKLRDQGITVSDDSSVSDSLDFYID